MNKYYRAPIYEIKTLGFQGMRKWALTQMRYQGSENRRFALGGTEHTLLEFFFADFADETDDAIAKLHVTQKCSQIL